MLKQALYQIVLYNTNNTNGTRRHCANGVPFPKILHSWEGITEVTNAFASKEQLNGDDNSQYRLMSDFPPQLLNRKPLRSILGIHADATELKLIGMCGVDAPLVVQYGAMLPGSVAHFSVNFL